MTDLFTVGEKMADVAETVDGVTALKSSIELLSSHESADLSPHSLSSTFEDSVTEPEYDSLLYGMKEAEIIQEGEIDHERLDAAAGCAMALSERGSLPENEFVVNVPEGDEESIGRFFGSLVVRLIELIGGAEEEIVIMNPFFSQQAFPNVVSPVSGALKRDVSVTLITRYLTYGDDDDARDFVERLSDETEKSEENLNLYEYIDTAEDSNDTIHAKMTMVDRRAAYLGTANLTHRGLRDNLEVGVIFRDDTVDQIARFVEEILASRYLHEVEINGEDFKRV